MLALIPPPPLPLCSDPVLLVCRALQWWWWWWWRGQGREARIVTKLDPVLDGPELLDYLPISTNCGGRLCFFLNTVLISAPFFGLIKIVSKFFFTPLSFLNKKEPGFNLALRSVECAVPAEHLLARGEERRKSFYGR